MTAITPSALDPGISLVIPAYNEGLRIGETLAAVRDFFEARGCPYEIIVVDDGSLDDTATVAAHAHPGVKVLRSATNRGKGHAVRCGLLAAAGDRILFSDADLATPIEELDRLQAELHAGADVAIASRGLRASRIEVAEPLLRVAAGKTFNLAIRLLLGVPFWDTQCGFKLYTRRAARAIAQHQSLDGWAFDVEHVWLAHRLGFVVREVPVRWRHGSGSKVRVLRDGTRMLADVLRLRLLSRPLPRREQNDRPTSATGGRTMG